ncbi:MAG TPA: TIGR00300 family protein, partial [Vicinamibacteria bacterium]
MVQETVRLEGHLIDSDILRRVFDRIVEEGGEFEVVDFKVGKTNDEASSAEIAVKAKDPQTLDTILEGLGYLGAVASLGNVQFGAAEADGIL